MSPQILKQHNEECVCVCVCVCVSDYLEALTDRGEIEGRTAERM